MGTGMGMKRAAALVVAVLLSVTASGCSSADVDAFCDQYHRSLEQIPETDGVDGPDRAFGPGAVVAWLDEITKLAAVAPEEIAGDAKVTADAFEELRPQAEQVDAGTLDYNEFGRVHLAGLIADPQFVAANARVEAYISEHCAAG